MTFLFGNLGQTKRARPIPHIIEINYGNGLMGDGILYCRSVIQSAVSPCSESHCHFKYRRVWFIFRQPM